jgi:hypothetical protein
MKTPAPKGKKFRREVRYLVLKVSDIKEHLDPWEARHLHRLAAVIARGRKVMGKRPLTSVVVERDWPEYEPTWAAIKQRMSQPG